MSTNRVSLDFYALGNFPQKNIEIPRLKFNSAFKDTSSDIFNRNKICLNSNKIENLRSSIKESNTLKNSNKEFNDYLNPIKTFKNNQRYNIKDNLVNKETFRLERDKLFTK